MKSNRNEHRLGDGERGSKIVVINVIVINVIQSGVTLTSFICVQISVWSLLCLQFSLSCLSIDFWVCDMFALRFSTVFTPEQGRMSTPFWCTQRKQSLIKGGAMWVCNAHPHEQGKGMKTSIQLPLLSRNKPQCAINSVLRKSCTNF